MIECGPLFVRCIGKKEDHVSACGPLCVSWGGNIEELVTECGPFVSGTFAKQAGLQW